MRSINLYLRASDALGDLVRIVAVLALQLLHQRDVSLLSDIRRDALINNLLPGGLLCLALYRKCQFMSLPMRPTNITRQKGCVVP
jgi:hypothetical protein